MSTTGQCPNCGHVGTLKRPEPSVVFCTRCAWRREHGVVVRSGSELRKD